MYKFQIGKKIRDEIPVSLVDCPEFNKLVTFIEEDFFELVRPFFKRSENHKDDGEYEAIGVAYHLNEHVGLKYLIIDDGVAYNFTNNNFPRLAKKLTRTIGFVKNCCYNDKTVSPLKAIEIFNAMKYAFEKIPQDDGVIHRRPCSMDKKVNEKILIPLISQLEDDCTYGRI